MRTAGDSCAERHAECNSQPDTNIDSRAVAEYQCRLNNDITIAIIDLIVTPHLSGFHRIDWAQTQAITRTRTAVPTNSPNNALLRSFLILNFVRTLSIADTSSSTPDS